MDVHKESISIAVLNFAGKVVMECVIETKASTTLQFIHGLSGDVRVTFEEGTWAAWLYDLLKPHVTELVVCNPRKNALLKEGSKSDRIDARKLAELLYTLGCRVQWPILSHRRAKSRFARSLQGRAGGGNELFWSPWKNVSTLARAAPKPRGHGVSASIRWRRA
jgi:hypothetical protein